MDKMIRTAKKSCEWPKFGDYEKTGQYKPSTSELLLEQICESFGTELLQAYVNSENGIKLVRESKPAVVSHPNGKRRVLQVQYTRFSPFHSSRATEVYNKNRAMQRGKREISHKSVWKEIKRQHEKWDSFEEVTNPEYIKHLNLLRWEKGLYFAVYDIDDGEGVEAKLKPFLVDKHVPFDGKLPRVYITFDIEPYFVVDTILYTMREHRGDVYDRIAIDFPQIQAEHGECASSALSLHPLNKLREPKKAFKKDQERFGENYEVSSFVPRLLTMGMIAGYLRKFCLDKDFY